MTPTCLLLSTALLAGAVATGQTKLDLTNQSRGVPTDLAVTRGGNTTLLIGTGCVLTKPCEARLGGITFQYVAQATVTLSSGTPTVRIYISDGSDGSPVGALKVGNSASSGVACSTGCSVDNNRAAFPGMSIPLAIWSASMAGQWDGSGTDSRAFLISKASPTAGLGIVITGGTSDTVAIDASLIPKKFSGAGVPGAVTGSARGDLYTDVTNGDSYQCFAVSACSGVGAGQWVKLSTGPAAAFQKGPWLFYGRASSVTGQKPSLGTGASSGTVMLGKIDTAARQMHRIAFQVTTAATSNCGSGMSACGLVIALLSEDRSAVVCQTETGLGGNGATEKDLNTTGPKSLAFASGSAVSGGVCTLPFGNYWWAIGTDSGELQIAADAGVSSANLLGNAVPGDVILGTIASALTGGGSSLGFGSLASSPVPASMNLPVLIGIF